MNPPDHLDNQMLNIFNIIETMESVKGETNTKDSGECAQMWFEHILPLRGSFNKAANDSDKPICCGLIFLLKSRR